MSTWQDSFQPDPIKPMSPQQAGGIVDLYGQDGAKQSTGTWQDSFQPSDNSFLGNFGVNFLDTANRARVGTEQLGQKVGQFVYGDNPQDVSEIAGQKAVLQQLDQEKNAANITDTGIGAIGGRLSGDPKSWMLPFLSGLPGMAQYGAIDALTQPSETNTGLGERSANAAIEAPLMAGAGKALGTITEIPGGIANRVKGVFAQSPEELATQSEKNWAIASTNIKNAHAQGAILTPEAAAGIVPEIKKAMSPTTGEVPLLHPSVTPKTIGLLQSFEEEANQGKMSLSRLDEYRQLFGMAIPKIMDADGVAALKAKNAIADATANLTTHDFSVGNPAAAQQLRLGLNQWGQAARYDKLVDLGVKSEGDAGALQKNLTKYINSKPKGYSDEEMAYLRDAADRGTGQNIERGLGTFGFDLGKYKNVALPALVGTATSDAGKGAAASMIPHAWPIVAAGTIARQTGKYAARGKYQSLLDAIMNKDVTPPINTGHPLLRQLLKMGINQ